MVLYFEKLLSKIKKTKHNKEMKKEEQKKEKDKLKVITTKQGHFWLA